MRRCFQLAFALVAATGLGGCSWLVEPSPENIFLRIDGERGLPVQMLVSTQFVAAIDEQGTTRVQIFHADTVLRTLPVDTGVNIAVPQQFFVEVQPVEVDSMAVTVRVRVDERLLVDERGLLLRAKPWRYVYVYNRPVTRTIEVRF